MGIAQLHSYIFLSLTTFLVNVSSTTAAAIPCSSSYPVQIPIRNTTITDYISQRGIALQVGTPGQTLAFEASGRWNNTYIFDSSVSCPNLDTPVGCAGRWGGFFVESSSTSWAQAASFAALSTARETIGDHDQDLPGNDTVHLNSSLALTTFPLGISRVKDTYGSMNSIGLGSNSTLLNALVSAGTIASKTWAFFQGWTGAESNQQMDGSLVLGGYDKAKVMGNNITLPFSESLNCISHLIVTITDIKMNLKNGSNPSILGPSAGSAFKACIKPDVHVTGLSSDIWSSFVGISGVHEIGRSDGINFWGMLISAKGAYDGDLTFSFSPGLDIRIPNHQLVVPDVGITQQGRLAITNDSVREVLINSLPDVKPNDLPLFGRSFLSSAYLLVDNDHRQFSLWQSNPTTSQSLVALGPSQCASSPSIVSSPASALSSSAPASSLPAPTSSSIAASAQSSASSTTGKQIVPNLLVSKGGIGGIVVGVGALAALVTVAIFLIRRRRARRRSIEIHEVHGTDHRHYPPEMSVDQNPAQEMPLARHQPYVLAPYEMPTERFDGEPRELSAE